MEEEAEVQQVPRDPWVPLKTRKIDTAVYCGGKVEKEHLFVKLRPVALANLTFSFLQYLFLVCSMPIEVI